MSPKTVKNEILGIAEYKIVTQELPGPFTKDSTEEILFDENFEPLILTYGSSRVNGGISSGIYVLNKDKTGMNGDYFNGGSGFLELTVKSVSSGKIQVGFSTLTSGSVNGYFRIAVVIKRKDSSS